MTPRQLLLTFCLFLCAQLAHAGPRIERWQTSAGTRVLFVEDHSLPIIDVQIDVAAGAARDAAGKEGVAGLTRSLIDLGADGLDETQIANRLADLGARLSGGVDLDRASLTLRTLSMVDKRTSAFELLHAIIAGPTFPAAAFEREKARSLAALKEALTRPDAIASKAFWATMYPAHPYGRQATPESLTALRREDVLAFHAAHYAARSATIAIVGDLSRAEAEALAERLSGGLPVAAAVGELPQPQLPAAGEERIAHPAAQAHLLIGMPALKRGDPDFFPLAVGNYSLGGGGFVSRLVKEVRDKRGLAYSVHSYFLPLQQLGPFQIGLQTHKGQVAEALQVTRAVLDEFLAHGPSEAELLAAKQNLVGSFPLRLDSNRKILENVAMIAFYDLPLDYLDRYPENIERVTTAEIQSAFARRLPVTHLVSVVVAGD